MKKKTKLAMKIEIAILARLNTENGFNNISKVK